MNNLSEEKLAPIDLLWEMVAAIVDHPEEVEIWSEGHPTEENTTVVTISVAEDDVGKVLGKRAKTIRLIDGFMRVVFSIVGLKVFVHVGGDSRKRRDD